MDIAFDRADVIVTTGGLGHGRRSYKGDRSRVFQRKLVLDEETLVRIKTFFDKMKRPMTENNVKQAMIPEGAVVMRNDNGTAPGIIIEGESKTIIMMPDLRGNEADV